MYNLRYHIASLVAVFLALAIGLVLGTIVVERGFLDKQRTTLVQSLQTDYSALRSENTQLKRDLGRDHAFASDAALLLVDGALKGRTVLVIANTGRADTLSYTRDALREAGADVAVATFRSAAFGTADVRVADALSSVVTSPGPGGGTLAGSAAASIAVEWAGGAGSSPVTDLLVKRGQLTFENITPGRRPDGVVLLASFDGKADAALVGLAAAIQRAGVTGVGIETQASTAGVADASRGAGLSTVDDVETPEGAVSLVYLLSGRASGHFGTKPGATAAYPRLR